MVQYAGADDLIEDLSETPDVLDREPAKIEVPEFIFSLKIAAVARLVSLMSIPVTCAAGSRIA